MHSYFFSSSNRLTYFFDPRAVLTLGSLARTTVAQREFRQYPHDRHDCFSTLRGGLTCRPAIGCANSSHPQRRPRELFFIKYSFARRAAEGKPRKRVPNRRWQVRRPDAAALDSSRTAQQTCCQADFAALREINLRFRRLS
jgi:hypothetical protein